MIKTPILRDEPLRIGLPSETYSLVASAAKGSPAALFEVAKRTLDAEQCVGRKAALAAAEIPAFLAASHGGSEEKRFLAALLEEQADICGADETLPNRLHRRRVNLWQVAAILDEVGDIEGAERALNTLAAEGDNEALSAIDQRKS